jgi:hypothetical protein
VNPYRLQCSEPEEACEEFNPMAARGKVELRVLHRAVLEPDGLVHLYIYFQHNRRYEPGDDSPAWIEVARWKPEMPVIEESFDWMIECFIDSGFRALDHDDVVDQCFEDVWEDAHRDDADWERSFSRTFAQALRAA